MQRDGECGLAVDELRPGQFNTVAFAFEREFQRRFVQRQYVIPTIDSQSTLQRRVQWRHVIELTPRRSEFLR